MNIKIKNLKKMKIGSKSYKALMRKIYFFSIAIGVLGLTGKFYIWQFPEAQTNLLELLIKIALIWGAIVYCLFKFFSLFEPLKKDYNWELVFPELALGYEDDKFDLDNLEKLKDPKERGKS